MWISRYLCFFIIFSFMGWIYETNFCTIKRGKWENRGFLFGPICPIYGIGATAISFLIHQMSNHNIEFEPWQIFMIAVIGSAILEYVTSWVLEKLFHAIWWDYSELPFNIRGRVSLFTSLGFGFAGILVVYFIAPITEKSLAYVSPIMTEFLALFFCSLLTADFTLTVNALLHFDRIVTRIEDNFNKNMEMIVDSTIQQSNQINQNLIEKRNAINEQIYSLNGHVRGTIRRVHLFRDINKEKESIWNHGLSITRKLQHKEDNKNE